MIQITGVLVDPTNQPIQTTLRVTAQNSVTSITSASATVVIGVDGLYDFNLLKGNYRIDFLTDDEYNIGTLVTVAVDTPAVITLPVLLESHSYGAIELDNVALLEARILTLESRVTILEG